MMIVRKQRWGLRAIAAVQAAKGSVVLLAGFGILGLVHRDVQHLANRVIIRMHLNPARKFPQIFLEAAAKVNDRRLWIFAGMALAYSVLRLIEAYGLWKERGWAEWLAIITAALYLPLEFHELIKGVTWLKVAATGVNLIIVGYLCYAIRHPAQSPATDTFTPTSLQS